MTMSLLIILLAFIISMIISPLIIKLMKKLKAGQPILNYVDNHSAKSGCPTMGGIIFVIPIVMLMLIFGGQGITMGKYAAFVILAYSVIGFLDDFIKIKFNDNKGLKAYQKIIAQLSIAIIISIYSYKNVNINTAISIPFSYKTLELNYFYIPFIIIILLSTTNGVNLTDGLDGLATSVSIIFFTAFLIITLIGLRDAEYFGDVILFKEYQSLAIFISAFIGSLLAFLWFNSSPAKIFMGDTGSLAIGGGVACAGIFSNHPLLIIIIGIMYVVSCISVIIQVIYFKLTKGKRVFKMAPYHHHLEYKAIKEWKIVAYYSIITILMAVVGILSII